MKMSPWRSQGVLQAKVAVVEGNAAVESLIEMDFGARKAEALSLLGDLEALAFPLHDVVVADHALMNEAADAVEIFWRRTPCGLGFTLPLGGDRIMELKQSVGRRPLLSAVGYRASHLWRVVLGVSSRSDLALSIFGEFLLRFGVFSVGDPSRAFPGLL